MGLWWTKQHWDRFCPITSVPRANHHSTNFSIIIITWGWHYRPIGGRSAEWTQLDSTPSPIIPILKIILASMSRYSEWFLSFRIFFQILCTILTHACYVFRPWLDHFNNIWLVQAMKLLIMLFSAASYCFALLVSKYSPRHHSQRG
jgi:hypothetical protein